MGSTADLELEWGDGRHLFSLRMGQMNELQEKCGDINRIDGTVKLSGPGEIAQRLYLGTWRVNDIRETIRLALIGGGKKPNEAHTLCVRYVDERPLHENVLVARAILLQALTGPAEEEGTEKKEETPSESEATARSESASPTGGVVH